MREGDGVCAERKGVESRVINVVRGEKADKGSDEGPGSEGASGKGGDERGVRDRGRGGGREGLGARGVDVVDAASVIEGCEGLDGVANCDYGGLVAVSW